jgi:hypothetical protein
VSERPAIPGSMLSRSSTANSAARDTTHVPGWRRRRPPHSTVQSKRCTNPPIPPASPAQVPPRTNEFNADAEPSVGHHRCEVGLDEEADIPVNNKDSIMLIINYYMIYDLLSELKGGNTFWFSSSFLWFSVTKRSSWS